MNYAKAVVCRKCGATFTNRRFWAFPKNDATPRKRCPRCWAKGPFYEATKEDIEVFSNKIKFNLNLFGISELIIGLLVIGIAIYKLF